MRQVKLTKNSEHGDKGSVVYVKNNVAHSIIDSGVGKLYKRESKGTYQNKMMETKNKMYSCSECEFTSSSKRGLSIHKSQIH